MQMRTTALMWPNGVLLALLASFMSQRMRARQRSFLNIFLLPNFAGCVWSFAITQWGALHQETRGKVSDELHLQLWRMGAQSTTLETWSSDATWSNLP